MYEIFKNIKKCTKYIILIKITTNILAHQCRRTQFIKLHFQMSKSYYLLIITQLRSRK